MRETEQIGRNIKHLREKAGLSRRAVGHHLGVSVQQISKYEKGVNRLPGDKLYRLQKLLNVPYESFFAGLDSNLGRDLSAWEAYLKIAAVADENMRVKIRDVVAILAR